MTLPNWYEDFLQQALRINLRERKTLKSLAESLSVIKEGLTRKSQREGFIDASYLKDERIRKAYAVYYMTNNILKIFPPLDEIALSGFFDDKRELNILDIGSGPGTGVFGTLLWLARHGKTEQASIEATDKVEANFPLFHSLKEPFLRCLATGMKTHLKAHRLDIERESRVSSPPYDLVTALNVVNEIGLNGEQNIIQILKSSLAEDGFGIFIDPALHDTSRKLLMFRGLLVSEGFTVYSPCFMDSPCPALIHPKDWCHTEVFWERPGFIRELDEMVGNIHKSLKFSYLVVSKNGKRLADFLPKEGKSEMFRVVSEFMPEKGKGKVFLCNGGGRRQFVRLNKHRSDENEDFANLKRYDVVSLDKYEERADFCSILPDSRLAVLNRES